MYKVTIKTIALVLKMLIGTLAIRGVLFEHERDELWSYLNGDVNVD